MQKSDVVAINGGLGNQLFQYCFAVWLRERTGRPTRFDVGAMRFGTRSLELQHLGIDVRSSIVELTKILPYPRGRFGPIGGWTRQLIGPKEIHFESPALEVESLADAAAWWYGYWQRMRFVDAALPTVRSIVAPLLTPQPGVGMHVRRGDFLGNEHLLDARSYRSMLMLYREVHGHTGPVTVFSDDLDWCVQHLDLGVDFETSTSGSAAGDLLALASFDGLVLSRSTFSWWAAMLRERDESTVVVQEPYFPLDALKERDLVRSGWKKMSHIEL